MSDPTDWQLLARYLARECSESEKEKVKEWINSDTENRKTIEFLKAVWNTSEVQPQRSDIKKLWIKVAEKAGITPGILHQKTGKTPISISKAEKSPFRISPGYRRILRYAALLILVISLPFMLKIIKTSSSTSQTIELKEILVDKGKKMVVTLPDDTRVTLDAGTLFSYPTRFTGETREVFLKGEGYFEVSPLKEKPFVVYANHAVIKVVGTKFNVRAWQYTKKVKVAVAEGKVSLRSETVSPGTAVLISKGHLSILPKKGPPSKPCQVDIKEHLGWIDRDIVFDDVPLQEILHQLERWYDIRFILDAGIPVSDRLTVHIQDKPVEDIIELIADLMGCNYKHEGHSVYLNSKDD